MIEVIKGDELIQLYYEYAEEDPIFYKAIEYLKNGVQMSEDQITFIDLVDSSDLDRYQVAKKIGMDRRYMDEIMRTKKPNVDFKSLTQKLNE
jgi:predicted regulator of amino acid metabolism with ACT domain